MTSRLCFRRKIASQTRNAWDGSQSNQRAMPTFASIRLQISYPALWLLPCSLPSLKVLLRGLLSAVQSTEEGSQIAGLELHLVDDNAIAKANQRYLGCHGPTNILSFPGGDELPGTLLLSLDTFARECRLYAQPEACHLVHLLSHGTAHLAGLEHGVHHTALQNVCLAALIAEPPPELASSIALLTNEVACSQSELRV